jgi:hypothetical protein
MKKCSAFLATKRMQLKITLRFHLIPIRMAILKGKNSNKSWWECGETGTLIHFWWECKLVQPLWQVVGRFLILEKLKTELPYDPVIPLLGIYPKEWQSGCYRGTCTPMFIAALFTIAKLWKQATCPTTDD